MDKQLLRKKYREIRNSVTNDTVAQRLLGWDIFKASKTVMTYISAKGEADTYPVLQSEKQLYVPVTFKSEGIIRPCEFYGVEKLKTGEYGILEPEPVSVYNGRLDLVIVPAICFNKKGYRVGYGGGYYDKFLQNKNGITAGFCFEECLTDQDFQQEFDKKVDYIITQERIIKI